MATSAWVVCQLLLGVWFGVLSKKECSQMLELLHMGLKTDVCTSSAGSFHALKSIRERCLGQ